MLRGARETQGAYAKDPKIAAIIAKATKLKPEAIEGEHAFAFDPDLDIANSRTASAARNAST